MAHFELKHTEFYQHDLVLAHFKLNQSYYLEKFPLPNSARRSGMSGCFSFQIPCLSTTTQDRPRMEQQGTTRLLPGKNDALEAKKSVKFLTWLIRLPPFTPSSHDIKSLCPGGSFGLVQNNQATSLLQGATLEHQIRQIFGIWSAYPGSPNSMGRLWRKRISFAVISCNHQPHQNYGPR